TRRHAAQLSRAAGTQVQTDGLRHPCERASEVDVPQLALRVVAEAGDRAVDAINAGEQSARREPGALYRRPSKRRDDVHCGVDADGTRRVRAPAADVHGGTVPALPTRGAAPAPHAHGVEVN